MPRIRPTTQWAMAWQQKYRKTHPTNMETRAPVVECADRAAARARQAATTPEICIAFPTVIERRPKILRLEDNADPFMFAVGPSRNSTRVRPERSSLALPPDFNNEAAGVSWPDIISSRCEL